MDRCFRPCLGRFFLCFRSENCGSHFLWKCIFDECVLINANLLKPFLVLSVQPLKGFINRRSLYTGVRINKCLVLAKIATCLRTACNGILRILPCFINEIPILFRTLFHSVEPPCELLLQFRFVRNEVLRIVISFREFSVSNGLSCILQPFLKCLWIGLVPFVRRFKRRIELLCCLSACALVCHTFHTTKLDIFMDYGIISAQERVSTL